MPRLPRYRPVGKPVSYLCRLGKLSPGKPLMTPGDRRGFLQLLLDAGKFYGYEVLAYRIGRDSVGCVVHHDGTKPNRAGAVARISDYYGEEAGERVRSDHPDKITAGNLQRAMRDYGDLSGYLKRVKGGFSTFYSQRHPDAPPAPLWRDRYRAEIVVGGADLLLAACAEVEKSTESGRNTKPERDRFCSFGAAVAEDADRRSVIRQLTGERTWQRAADAYLDAIEQVQLPTSKRHGRKGVFGETSLDKLIGTRANQRRNEAPRPRAKLTPQSDHIAALRAFKKRFGHTRVPLNWEENAQLATWVHARRSLHRQGRLLPALVAKLDALGFDWALPRGRSSQFDKVSSKLQPELYAADAAWVAKLDELEEYVLQNGHTKVTTTENPEIYRWLYNQKRRWRAEKLSAEKARLLRELGVKKPHPTGSTSS